MLEAWAREQLVRSLSLAVKSMRERWVMLSQDAVNLTDFDYLISMWLYWAMWWVEHNRTFFYMLRVRGSQLGDLSQISSLLFPAMLSAAYVSHPLGFPLRLIGLGTQCHQAYRTETREAEVKAKVAPDQQEAIALSSKTHSNT